MASTSALKAVVDIVNVQASRQSLRIVQNMNAYAFALRDQKANSKVLITS